MDECLIACEATAANTLRPNGLHFAPHLITLACAAGKPALSQKTTSCLSLKAAGTTPQTFSPSAEDATVRRTPILLIIADIGVFVPRRQDEQQFAGLFIEMKRQDGVASDVSEKQQQAHQSLYCVATCYGWRRALSVLVTYLGWEDHPSYEKSL